MRIACWISKAADTHTEYVILIAFPLQQWLHVHASMLRYTSTASLVKFCFLNVLYSLCIAHCNWCSFTNYCFFQRRAKNELFVTLSVSDEDR